MSYFAQSETEVILASASPRRQELLHSLFESFSVEAACVEEIPDPALSAEQQPEYLAGLKCAAVAALHPDALVIGADTGVFIDGRMIGKPKSREDGLAMLEALSGREHQVITGCALQQGSRRMSFSECTRVRFFPLSKEELEAYLELGEYADKAGAYGIQGAGRLLVEGIEGDYYNVMGLPVARLARAIGAFQEE